LGRVVFLIALFAALAAAQAPAPQSPGFQQAIEKPTAAWQALAKGLELKIARMLPCDPRVRDAIEEVSRASETRLAVQAQYLQAAAGYAKRGTEAARATLEAEQTGARDAEIETAESEQDRIAIEAQIADLAESVKSKPDLDNARTKLESIAAMVRQGGSDAQAQGARRTALIAALGDLLAAFQAREKAVAAEINALAAETARWNEYYAARLARAQTECSITHPAPGRKKK